MADSATQTLLTLCLLRFHKQFYLEDNWISEHLSRIHRHTILIKASGCIDSAWCRPTLNHTQVVLPERSTASWQCLQTALGAKLRLIISTPSSSILKIEKSDFRWINFFSPVLLNSKEHITHCWYTYCIHHLDHIWSTWTFGAGSSLDLVSLAIGAGEVGVRDQTTKHHDRKAALYTFVITHPQTLSFDGKSCNRLQVWMDDHNNLISAPNRTNTARCGPLLWQLVWVIQQLL